MEDVVIVGAKRTPFGKSFRGSFKDSKEDFLLYNVIRGALSSYKIDPKSVEDVVIGNVLSPKANMMSRMVCLSLGFRVEVPILVVNRQCVSGLEAINQVAMKIRNGDIQLGMAGGYEMMSIYSMINEYETETPVVEDCKTPMGITSENLCKKFGYQRSELDAFALKSQNRAIYSRKDHLDIIPVQVGDKIIRVDDGIRETDMEKLSKLKPCFEENGLSTAGNSSQISDGASVVFLASRKYAIENNLKILAKFVDYTTKGVEPKTMGEGPAAVIPKLLSRNNLEVSDIYNFEINEAFSSVTVHAIKSLNLDVEKVNPMGGAIAIGHPLGASGTRVVGTMLNYLPKGKYGLIAFCAAGGLGGAALILRE